MRTKSPSSSGATPRGTNSHEEYDPTWIEDPVERRRWRRAPPGSTREFDIQEILFDGKGRTSECIRLLTALYSSACRLDFAAHLRRFGRLRTKAISSPSPAEFSINEEMSSATSPSLGGAAYIAACAEPFQFIGSASSAPGNLASQNQ